jgi:hypothetical protein
MDRDYFTILGLSPGRYNPGQVTQRFEAERVRLLAQLGRPATHATARRGLDELHLAYATLRDPRTQAQYLRTRTDGCDDVARLRQLIAASLEDGLLRYSRRQDILAEARRVGFSDFQTQLLIAQVQFGDEQLDIIRPRAGRAAAGGATRAWASFAAAGVLALALFLAMIRWLGN